MTTPCCQGEFSVGRQFVGTSQLGIMRPKGELTIAPDSVALNENNTLVLDDDDSHMEQPASMHVHFAYSQPLQSTHGTYLPMPEHLHPGRSKKGSFFPSHALDSTSSLRDSADSSQAITWSHHATPKQHRFMPRHDQGGSDSLDASGQDAISWSLTSQEHTASSSHATAQRLDQHRQAIAQPISCSHVPDLQRCSTSLCIVEATLHCIDLVQGLRRCKPK